MNKKKSSKKLMKVLILASSLGLLMPSVPSAIIAFAAETTTSIETTNSSDEDSKDKSLNDLRDPLSSIEVTAESTEETDSSVLPETTLSTTSEIEEVEVDEEEVVEETEETEALTKTAKVDLKATGVADVTDWKSFAEALGDTKIHTISLKNDIALSGVLENVDGIFDKSSVNLNSEVVYLFVTKAASSRTLVIDGGGHTFDFGRLAIGFTDQSVNQLSNWDIRLENIKFQSTNMYAPFIYQNMYDSRSTIRTENNGMSATNSKNAKLTFGENAKHNFQVSTFVELIGGIGTHTATEIEFIADIVSTEGVQYFRNYVPGYNHEREWVADTRERGNNKSNQVEFVYFYGKAVARNLVIEGNGFSLDSGALTFCFRPNTTNKASQPIWDITWQNMNVYHGNYWGISEYYDLEGASRANSITRFKNFTDRGAQLIESPQSLIEFSGEIDVQQGDYYTSKGKNGQTIRTWQSRENHNQTVSGSAVTFAEDSKVYLSSTRGPVVHVTDRGGSWVAADVVIKKGAEVELARSGMNGEGSGQGTRSVIHIVAGNLIVEEGATLKATSTDSANPNLLHLQSRESSFIVEKNAQVDFETVGYTRVSGEIGADHNPIYMGGGSILVNGTWNVKGTSMGNSNRTLLHAQNRVDFKIGREGSFDLVSDSTNSAQILMRFVNKDSSFKFSDAKRVNLQKTKAIQKDNNGLISMGDGGVLEVAVQNVYQWEAGNLAGGITAEDGGYTHAYEPMSNMRLTYNGTGLKDRTGNSMFVDTTNRFLSNFTTQGQQRILFEFVPAPSVNIHSISNDNPADPGSMTIKGYARPNTHIRLWEEAKNGTTPALVKGTEDTVKTPIEDINNFDKDAVDGDGNKMYSDNPLEKYTVVADANGDWSYTIKKSPAQWLTANNVIHAFGFNNLKSEEPLQIVLDKTAPTAKPVKYYAVKGDPVLKPNVFIKEAKDTNPVAAEAKINYAFNSATDIATLMNTASTEANPHKVLVDVSDSAIDPVTGSPTPNTVTIEAELVVLAQPITIDMNADEITVEYKDIRELTDAKLKQWVIDTSGATGYKVDNGGVVDLTNKIIVSDLGKLNDINAIVAADGNMVVTLTIPKADSGLANDYHATIKVKVINLLSTLTVEFTNEAGDVMPGYTLTITEKDGEKLVVSDVLDLTAKQYGIQAQLDKLIAAGYEVVTRPAKETAFELDNTEVTIQYKLTGLVYIASYPENFNFGVIEYDDTVKQVDDSQPDKDLIVNDTRANKSQWILGARVETPMTHDVEKSSILVDALQYFYGKDKVVLNDGTQRIYQEEQSTGKDLKVTNISDTWGTTKDADGVKLIVDPSTSNVLKGTYEGVIQWQFMQGAP